ncbi:hypothetical protein SNE25_24630 [Mucilaginibacter sabulilitoris]|uniref:BatC protein n=1 Tax=Mucilaginibacter sabulilitoris TaxID=1173583 RepID=A0ABZ0TH44_9SPHI|nr:hypothetical protein [Mucilaginibacter sabulilitoris]WPU92516.1 hypothetical protein SNE25_24630 [Mucilaginibacter sabulilitoris]
METIGKNKAVMNNDDSDLHNDELGENTGEDTLLAKQAKLKPGEDEQKQQASSNMEQGPAGENL